MSEGSLTNNPRSWATVNMQLAQPEHMSLPSFDYTKLTAINMCPTWGITQYTLHKTMPGGGRAMALEAGSTMHDCFAAVRLYQLGYVQGQMELMRSHARRIFNERAVCFDITADGADHYSACRAVTLGVLESAGFIDDPFDKRRTYVNLEAAIMYYIQRWDFNRYPIWHDNNGRAGVEIPFAIHVAITRVDGSEHEFLYTGRVDGIHTDNDGSLLIGENKTASRLDHSWRASFDMSHQVTGYCIAASLFAQADISRGLVFGLNIPLPRTLTDGFAIEPVTRPAWQKQRMIAWMEHTIELHDTYKDNILDAPMYTHSCNRYFRPCSMIPFCVADEDERKLILSEMEHRHWSPLHEVESKAND